MWTSHFMLQLYQFQCHKVNNTINSECKDYTVLKKCAMLGVLRIHTVIILVIIFMQGIYNYIHETNHVSRVYSVAAVLYLQFVLKVMLFHPWNMFSAFTLALFYIDQKIGFWQPHRDEELKWQKWNYWDLWQATPFMTTKQTTQYTVNYTLHAH
jgi:hypothetical protein